MAVAPPVLTYVSGATSVETAFFVMSGLGLVSLALTAVVLRASTVEPRVTPQPGDD